MIPCQDTIINLINTELNIEHLDTVRKLTNHRTGAKTGLEPCHNKQKHMECTQKKTCSARHAQATLLGSSHWEVHCVLREGNRDRVWVRLVA